AAWRSARGGDNTRPQRGGPRARHKDDQVAQQREIMELYRRHGLNPLSGCLPMLLQLPLSVGLYNAISHAIELRHAPFLLWITDLSAPDRLVIGGIGIPVLTLLMGASMLVQQWMTPQQGDPAQQKVMMLMPLMFTYMFMGFPSGLVLYWLVNNVLTIRQQNLLLPEPKRAPPPPTFPGKRSRVPRERGDPSASSLAAECERALRSWPHRPGARSSRGLSRGPAGMVAHHPARRGRRRGARRAAPRDRFPDRGSPP